MSTINFQIRIRKEYEFEWFNKPLKIVIIFACLENMFVKTELIWSLNSLKRIFAEFARFKISVRRNEWQMNLSIKKRTTNIHNLITFIILNFLAYKISDHKSFQYRDSTSTWLARKTYYHRWQNGNRMARGKNWFRSTWAFRFVWLYQIPEKSFPFFLCSKTAKWKFGSLVEMTISILHNVTSKSN